MPPWFWLLRGSPCHFLECLVLSEQCYALKIWNLPVGYRSVDKSPRFVQCNERSNGFTSLFLKHVLKAWYKNSCCFIRYGCFFIFRSLLCHDFISLALIFLQKNRAVSKKICRGNYRNICHLPYLLSTSQVDLLPWNLNCKFRSIFWVSFKFQSIGCPGKLKLSPRITVKQNITEKISKQVMISVQVIDRIWYLKK